MSRKPLVSIISPCYNGEKYISYFLESVLAQSYSSIELIMVDDGSTDRTKEIIQSYQARIQSRGYKLRYIYQKNSGQAAAINQGLRVFAGEYLMWVDSDDVLYPENVEKKVRFLEEHLECGFVQCLAEEVRADALDIPIRKLGRIKPDDEDAFFEDLIYERDVCFCPGVMMAKREAIYNAIPSLHIFESRQGQNWQLMLPLAHMYRCGYIEEVLFKIVAHDDSHSRMNRTYQQQIARHEGFQELLINTIRNLPDMDECAKAEWIERVIIKHQKKILEIAYQNHDMRALWQATEALRVRNYKYRKDLLYLFKVSIASNKVGNIIYRAMKQIKSKL